MPTQVTIPDDLAPLLAQLADHEARLLALEGGGPPPPANPTIIEFRHEGGDLWWTTANGQAAELHGGEFDHQQVNLQGMQSVSPATTTTYTLTVTGAPGTTPATASVTVTVMPPPPGDLGDVYIIPVGQTLVIDQPTTVGTLYVNGTLDLRSVLTTKDIPFTDAEQMEVGVIVKGKLIMRGTPKTPFLRCAVAPLAGQTSLTLLGEAVGWQAGDRLLLPDSRNINDPPPTFVYHDETVTIASVTVSTDGSRTTVELAGPLGHSHPGAVDRTGFEFFPHAANLTRSVRIKSANPSGTRGHVMLMDEAEYDCEHANFGGLGRTTKDPVSVTNIAGRYPFHVHKLRGENKVRRLVGCTFTCPLDPMPFIWPITIHDTDGTECSGNVVYNWAGAGIMLEERSAGNDIEDNFVCKIVGAGQSRADSGKGREGVGIWGQNSTDNVVTGNVVAQAALFGFTFFGGGPFRTFSRNEVYAGRRGFTCWEINGADTNSPQPNAPQSTVDIDVWGCWDTCVGLGYPAYNLTFQGRWHGAERGFDWGDYRSKDFVFEGVVITGCRWGIKVPLIDQPGEIRLQGCHLDNSDFDVWIIPNAVTGGGGWTPAPGRVVRLVGTPYDPAKTYSQDPTAQVIVE